MKLNTNNFTSTYPHMNTIFFLVFLIIAVLFSASCKNRGRNAVPPADLNKPETPVSEVPSGEHILTVYYFHTTYRCKSCIKIEQFTKEALMKNFNNKINTGRIVFKAINVDEPDNKRFIERYQLFTKSVVLVDSANGKEVKWKRLDETWNHLGEADSFYQYIEKEVSAFIMEAG